MIVTVKTQPLQTLADVRAFIEGSRLVDFEVTTREDAYTFATTQLGYFGYPHLGACQWK